MGQTSDEVRRAVSDALKEHDRATAVRIAVEAVSSGAIDVASLYSEVLVPLLHDTGEAWRAGDTTVWEEHLASQAVRSIVELVYPAVLKAKADVPATGRSVLLACPPEEAHDLGLRLVADRFDMAGWTTYFLGADTPFDEVVDAAGTLQVDAVVLSSSTHFHLVALRRHVDRLRAELPGVDVWVGGPAFAVARDGWRDDEIVDLDALLGDAHATAEAGPEVGAGAPEDARAPGEARHQEDAEAPRGADTPRDADTPREAR
ncbi:MAG: cobalamin-dependent protein [Thermoleophilia bacterium]|nr:cobalamin-dependent protein [Thermoleophilia bacterium]